MKTVGVVLFSAALLVVVASASAGLSDRPTLRLLDRAPVVVRGEGFNAKERVTVVLVADRRFSEKLRAGSGGNFVVRFNRSLGHCTRFSLQAYGSSGSRARLLPARFSIDCMPND
jgi:hypothetical protein